jgi:N-methylhydantoinase A
MVKRAQRQERPHARETQRRFLVGVDIGGTFTDAAVLTSEGKLLKFKSLTTPSDPSMGFFAVLDQAAEGLGLSLNVFLKNISSLVHGSTIATNLIVEGKGAKIGLLTTRGHEDTLAIGRVHQVHAGLSEREVTHLSALDKADPPLVPEELVEGITERVGPEGEVIVSLNEACAEKAVRSLLKKGVEAIAICFLWSFLEPVHEKSVARLIRRKNRNIPLSLSCELAPVLGEYERMATTALNSYVAPRVNTYLQRLERKLEKNSQIKGLLLMQSNGGLSSTKEIRKRPLSMLDSGPVGGALGAKFFGNIYGETNIISTDMGGTSFDVSLVHQGEPEIEAEPVVGKYHYRMPKVMVKSIGAGGGSIAWIDSGGLLRVGPQSAGALPGPSCYRRGGTEPTVTDADLLLGYLNPDYFVGGQMRLDSSLAEAALRKVGTTLGLAPVQVASGIFNILNAQMADLIRRCTIERGLDPREFLLVAYGGAGPTHATFFARDVGAKGLCIFADSSVFSAFGMLTTEVKHTAETSLSLYCPFSSSACQLVERQLNRLSREILARLRGHGREVHRLVRWRRFALMRYRMQVHEIAVEIPPDRFTLEQARKLEQCFEKSYIATYGPGTAYTKAGIEVVGFRMEGFIPKPQLPIRRGRKTKGSPTKESRRPAYFEGRFSMTPVYRGETLSPGHKLRGPCIIERMGDSVVIPPGSRGEVDAFGNLFIEI